MVVSQAKKEVVLLTEETINSEQHEKRRKVERCVHTRAWSEREV